MMLTYMIAPILKDEYLNKGLTVDFDSVIRAIEDIDALSSPSIECDGAAIEVTLGLKSPILIMMRTVQRLFPHLSFSVEHLSDEGVLTNWEF